MKRISCLRPILFALIIMSAVACTDNTVTPTAAHGTVLVPQEHYMVANNWYADGSGNFVSVFGNMNGSSPSAVYCFRNNVKTLISGGAIDFEAGRLWAETGQGSLRIVYKGNIIMPYIPFTTVELIVVY